MLDGDTTRVSLASFICSNPESPRFVFSPSVSWMEGKEKELSMAEWMSGEERGIKVE